MPVDDQHAPAERWPDVICIGATKAGTTSLLQYLRLHPDVHVANPKEPDFFSYRWASRDEAWYRSLFASERRVAIEFSTSYSEYPHDAATAGNIASVLPDAKLIYLVRHPVERFISHARYWGWYDSFEPLDDPEAVGNMARTSLYGERLESYLRHFRRDQILILKSEELAAHGAGVMSRVHAFIGVPDRDGDFSQRHNETVPETGTKPIDRAWVEARLGDWRADARHLADLAGLDISDWLE